MVIEPVFPLARFRKDLLALRGRERGTFQILQGECDGTVFHRPNTGAHQPLFQNSDATDGALIEKLPRPDQVRFGRSKWQLFLKSKQNAAEYLPVFGRI